MLKEKFEQERKKLLESSHYILEGIIPCKQIQPLGSGSRLTELTTIKKVIAFSLAAFISRDLY